MQPSLYYTEAHFLPVNLYNPVYVLLTKVACIFSPQLNVAAVNINRKSNTGLRNFLLFIIIIITTADGVPAVRYGYSNLF
jgi:hypothetical protein